MATPVTPPLPPRHHPRPVEVLNLMLHQRELQPLLDPVELSPLTNTCTTLRVHGEGAVHRNKLLYSARLLERQLVPPEGQKGPVRQRLYALHSHESMGSMQALLEDCRDTIWQSDQWRLHSTLHKLPREVPVERRRTCLAYMWAAKMDRSLEQGYEATEAARKFEPEALFKMLAVDAAAGTMHCANIAASAYLGVTWTSWCASSAVKAWKVGTVAGKGKAVLFGAGAVGASGLSVAVIGGSLWLGKNYLELTAEDRREAYATLYGKDALFCEVITMRRYRRGRR